MEQKTNVMRLLDKTDIKYKYHDYSGTDAISGTDVAAALGQDPARVFKTLVTVSKSKKYYVYMVPVDEELNFKKAAACVGEKAIEMIKSKDLLPITGYIHGGCSPIGMKKRFTTTVDITAEDFDTIVFSAGKIGYQVEMNIADLKKILDVNLADIIS